MKLLITGCDKIFAIENFYVKYLRELGIEVFHFKAQSIFYDYYQKNIFNKLVFRTGLSGIYKSINKSFREAVKSFNPDVIWVFKGMEILPKSLQWAKERNIKLINYNPDSPFIFSGSGSGNENITESISLYHLHLTYHSDVKKKVDFFYKIPAAILPFGFDLSEDLFYECSTGDEVEKACFVGNPDMQRAAFIRQLAEGGVQPDVYGHNWKKFIDHPNVNILPPVYGHDFWRTLRKYRVQLNLMRAHNTDTHNMRSFEVPGAGGIQLAPDTQDHKTYFVPEKEIFLYNSAADCIKQIQKLLALSKSDADSVRIQARQRSILSAYTYKDRANQALEQIRSVHA